MFPYLPRVHRAQRQLQHHRREVCRGHDGRLGRRCHHHGGIVGVGLRDDARRPVRNGAPGGAHYLGKDGRRCLLGPLLLLLLNLQAPDRTGRALNDNLSNKTLYLAECWPSWHTILVNNLRSAEAIRRLL